MNHNFVGGALCLPPSQLLLLLLLLLISRLGQTMILFHFNAHRCIGGLNFFKIWEFNSRMPKHVTAFVEMLKVRMYTV